MTPALVLLVGSLGVVFFLLLCWALFGRGACNQCGSQDIDDDLYW
jgi:hypothetical protein